MAEIINGLTEIKPIILNEANFGNNLNERLEAIDDNFESIISSEYLKGAPGKSFGYATFSNKQDFINPKNIWIKSGNINQMINGHLVREYLLNAIYGDNYTNLNEDEKLNFEFEFTFIYEVKDNKNIVRSSLPFVYYDKSIYDLNDKVLNEFTEDYSCVIIFDNDEFKKLNSFPTIYYNSEREEFCWEINGIKTQLTATGPKGPRGLNSSMNIVKVSKPESMENGIQWQIDSFLYQNPNDNTYEWKDINEYVDENDKALASEVLTLGSPCIALSKYGDHIKLTESAELPEVQSTEDPTENDESYIIIGQVDIREQNGLYYIITWEEMTIENSISETSLMNIFDSISSNSLLKGLYVPDLRGNGKHMFYAEGDPDNDNNILYLRHVDNEGETLDNSSILNCENLKSNTIETGSITCDIIESLSENGHIDYAGQEISMSSNDFTIKINNKGDIILRENAPLNITMLDNASININDRQNNPLIEYKTNKLTINEDISVSEQTVLNDLKVNGNAEFNDNAEFNGNVNFNSPVNFNDNISIKNQEVKIQYKPIITCANNDWYDSVGKIKNIEIDPGNHDIWDIIFYHGYSTNVGTFMGKSLREDEELEIEWPIREKYNIDEVILGGSYPPNQYRDKKYDISFYIIYDLDLYLYNDYVKIIKESLADEELVTSVEFDDENKISYQTTHIIPNISFGDYYKSGVLVGQKTFKSVSDPDVPDVPVGPGDGEM